MGRSQAVRHGFLVPCILGSNPSAPANYENFFRQNFLRSNNLHNISNNIKELTDRTPIKKIFEVINNYSSESEVRYVGGCIRRIINKEKIDDIDLATNLKPIEVCDVLKK